MAPGPMVPAPMTPGEVLEPSPLDAGGMIRSSLRVIQRVPGLILGIAATQVGLIFVSIILVLVAVLMAMGGAAIFEPEWDLASERVPAIIAALVVGMLLAMLVSALASVKLMAMASCAVDQLARGQQPTWGSTSQASRGVISRAIAVYAIFFLAYLGLVFVGTLAVFAIAAATEGTALEGWARQMMLLLTIAFPFVWLGLLYVGVRLLYINQVLAIEGLGGLQVLRRAWELTAGRFWPTLGYYLLGSLCAMVPGYVLQAFTAPLSAGQEGNLLMALGFTVLSFVTQLLVLGWTMIYIAVMYVDQRRRLEMPPQPVLGWGTGFPAQQAPVAWQQPQQQQQPPLPWQQ